MCEVCVTVLDVRKGLLDKSLNWGTEKRRVLHQLFNPSAMAKPATDGRCPQRPKCLQIPRGRVLRFVAGSVYSIV